MGKTPREGGRFTLFGRFFLSVSGGTLQTMQHILDFAGSPYGIIAMTVSIYVFVITLWNLIYKLRIPKKSGVTNGPLVSVCIPARDEEANIGRCLDSLLKQTYKNIEIIVYDDASSDNTWQVLTRYADTCPNVRVLRGKEKPSSWKGKSYALQRCTENARGEVLYTTDADTFHSPEAVAWAVERLKSREIDAFTAMPRQVTGTLGEKLVVPMVYLPAFLVPFALLNNHRLKGAVFGIGQLFVFRTEAFRAVGGMDAVKSTITDDVAMGRVLRKAGFRYEFLDARGHVECKMYGNFTNSVRGFLKNFYEIVSAAPYLIVSSALVGIFALFVIPPVFAGIAAAAGPASAGTVFLLPVVLFVLSWGANLAYYRTPLYMAPLYPVFFIVIAVMFCVSLVQVQTGREPVWKTRAVGA